MLPPEEQLALIKRGGADVFPEQELLEKLRLSCEKERPLRVKLGIDPTTPDLHLGHTVVLNKLRLFQRLGHVAVLIIGDYTGRVGDPSGHDRTRPMLSEEQLRGNAGDLLEMARRTLLPENLEVRRNGEWFEKMTLAGVIDLASRVSVARLLERDEFSDRLRKDLPLTLQEILYPLMQGYDSVMVEADVELGGSDQHFNLTFGRRIQRSYGQSPQVCLTVPLLVGTDGVKKMSKTYGNFVALDDAPKEMFDKLLSIPDALTRDYLALLTDAPEKEIDELLALPDPREAKVRLAVEVIGRFHGREAARRVEAAYRAGGVPEGALRSVELEPGRVWVVRLLQKAGFASSASEGRRLIRGGAVLLDGRRVEDEDEEIEVRDGMVLRAGKKRWARLVVGRTAP